MKKFGKVFLALLAILSFGVLVSCRSNSTLSEELKTEEVKKALEEIQLNTANVKSEYYLGQAFSSSGLTVKAIFNDKSEEDISSNVTVDSSSFDANAIGQYSIKVSYTYEGRVRTSYYTVQVKTILDNIDVYIVGLNVSLGKVTYDIYEELDLSDLKVTAVYSDDTTEELEEGSYTIDDQFVDKTRGNVSPLIISTKKEYT
ncbi:MAG: bacterial Ig-like domain-containing protein, partial [Anaeroplasmataceae bacterium]|nr:bacterial Ig-like domain-containing protein [Anaeroplasmataceae bacterium]